jgi:hypothetical protein
MQGRASGAGVGARGDGGGHAREISNARAGVVGRKLGR